VVGLDIDEDTCKTFGRERNLEEATQETLSKLGALHHVIQAILTLAG
jgi:hypothetical protein